MLDPAMPLRKPFFTLLSTALASLCLLGTTSAEEIAIDTFVDGFNTAGGTAGAGFNGFTGPDVLLIQSGTYGWTDTDSGSNIWGDNRTVNVGPSIGGGFDIIQRITELDGNPVSSFSYSGAAASHTNTGFSYNDAAGVNLERGGDDNATNLVFDILDMDTPARENVDAKISFTDGIDTVSTYIFFNEIEIGKNSIDLDSLEDYTGNFPSGLVSWSETDWESIRTNLKGIEIDFIVPTNQEDFVMNTLSFSTISSGGLTQIPEPTSLILLGALIGGGLFRSPRRSRA